MAIDFKRIATQAREQDRAKAEEKQKQSDNERKERLHRTQAGIEQLDTKIMPLLESAKKDFEEEGIPCVISRDYDVTKYTNKLPSVTFQCEGPKKKNRRGRELELKSIPVFISSDGDQVEISVGKSAFSRYPDGTITKLDADEAEESIAKALEKAVSSYFSGMASLREGGMWDQ